jgi:hypothetical protein
VPEVGVAAERKKRIKTPPPLLAFCNERNNQPLFAKSVPIGSRSQRTDGPVEVIKEREEVKQKPAETLCLVIWKCSEDFCGVIHMVFVSDSGVKW